MITSRVVDVQIPRVEPHAERHADCLQAPAKLHQTSVRCRNSEKTQKYEKQTFWPFDVIYSSSRCWGSLYPDATTFSPRGVDQGQESGTTNISISQYRNQPLSSHHSNQVPYDLSESGLQRFGKQLQGVGMMLLCTSHRGTCETEGQSHSQT
jgi:hypothetical protein